MLSIMKMITVLLRHNVQNSGRTDAAVLFKTVVNEVTRRFGNVRRADWIWSVTNTAGTPAGERVPEVLCFYPENRYEWELWVLKFLLVTNGTKKARYEVFVYRPDGGLPEPNLVIDTDHTRRSAQNITKLTTPLESSSGGASLRRFALKGNVDIPFDGSVVLTGLNVVALRAIGGHTSGVHVSLK